ncbi:hypothetical protein MDA_GLEAN10011412 [Myotis davidii]|uniref:Uncharacterized protein n=1 Tax=Myotis davidii TaxID=225400 RepID=L5LJK5_MYODS|nr:hypothetical protein MDA_GLEAN10011412 [Myotis davidii]
MALGPSPTLAKHPSGDPHPKGGVASLKTAISPSSRLARHPSADPHPEGGMISCKQPSAPHPGWPGTQAGTPILIWDTLQRKPAGPH